MVNLTYREKQILKFLTEGIVATKEIARELLISEPLVNKSLQSLYDKTGCRNKTKLALYAVQQYFQTQST